jgi:hypothetical protein
MEGVFCVFLFLGLWLPLDVLREALSYILAKWRASTSLLAAEWCQRGVVEFEFG